VKEAVSVAQATNDACVLPERVQEALGQLVGAAKEGPRRLRRLPRSARIARLRSPAFVLSGRDAEIESCETVWAEESIDLGDLPLATVKAITENSRPGGATTAPAVPLTSAGVTNG
jgi:hypothetical protein